MVPLLENYALAGGPADRRDPVRAVLLRHPHRQPADHASRRGFHADPGRRRRRAGAGDRDQRDHRRRDRASAAWSAAFRTPSFPIRRGAAAKAAKAPPAVSRETASWIALRGTLVVMPVFVLALTDPSFYLAAIMKTRCARPAGRFDRHALGRRELVGSTLMAAAMALVVWCRPVAVAQPVDADAVDDGGRAVGRRAALRGRGDRVTRRRSGATRW